LRITHVTETHIHADFVSGSCELAARTGAALYLSGEGGRDWQYARARDSGAEILSDGSMSMVGNVRLEARHTPGHTPEHISFLVTDTATATEPIGALTGDFIFVDDVDEDAPGWRERIAALRYVPPLVRLIWNTHHGYTASMLALRFAREFDPVASFWVGKLILDTVLAASRLKNAPRRPRSRWYSRWGC
jgi:glyoxylase-like metal-dependent hydrolase (beta-lactamase superfamily II)